MNVECRDVFRRRLEPLLEEECSDSDSEDNKPTPTNSDDQVNIFNESIKATAKTIY